MGIEIERKFLVTTTDGWLWPDPNENESKLLGKHISQGYLSLDPNKTVRVRTIGNKAFITVKGLTEGCTRPEFEYEIPYSDALQLLEMCGRAVIHKTRYTVTHLGWKWEIDWFLDELAGLRLAEIELESEDVVFPRPPWIGLEVTHNPKFQNSSLAASLLKEACHG